MVCRSVYISRAATAKKRPCWRLPRNWRRHNLGSTAFRLSKKHATNRRRSKSGGTARLSRALTATERRTEGGQHGEAVFALPCSGLTAVSALCRPSRLGAEARRHSAAREPGQPAQHVDP